MLFVVVGLALVMYCALYLIWESAHTRLDSTASVLRTLTNVLVMPQESIFVLLRGLIVIALCYALVDFFMSKAKRTKRRRPVTQTLKSTFNEDDAHTRRE